MSASDRITSVEPTTADETRRLRRSFLWTAMFTASLWLIKLVEFTFDLDFVRFGVYPRTLDGLTGILSAPLIHGSFAHLFANSPPLLVLGTALLFGYPLAARIVVPAVYLGAGAGVWLFAREAYHIGASGITFGMMFFVFTAGMLRWDRRAIGIALLALFLYGGMIAGLFPGKPGISFEGHVSGAITGVLLAVLLRRLDPPPPRKAYSWEQPTEGGPDRPAGKGGRIDGG